VTSYSSLVCLSITVCPGVVCSRTPHRTHLCSYPNVVNVYYPTLPSPRQSIYCIVKSSVLSPALCYPTLAPSNPLQACVYCRYHYFNLAISCYTPLYAYPQVHGILASIQAQPYLIDMYVRHELNLDLSIYDSSGCVGTEFAALSCIKG